MWEHFYDLNENLNISWQLFMFLGGEKYFFLYLSELLNENKRQINQSGAGGEFI